VAPDYLSSNSFDGGGVLLLTELLQGILNWIRTVQAERMQDYMSALIHEKAAVDLAFMNRQIITISWNKLAVMLARSLALLAVVPTAKQHYPSSYGCGVNSMVLGYLWPYL